MTTSVGTDIWFEKFWAGGPMRKPPHWTWTPGSSWEVERRSSAPKSPNIFGPPSPCVSCIQTYMGIFWPLFSLSRGLDNLYCHPIPPQIFRTPQYIRTFWPSRSPRLSFHCFKSYIAMRLNKHTLFCNALLPSLHYLNKHWPFLSLSLQGTGVLSSSN